MRSVLVAALASCAEGPLRTKARRFLVGLSSDELQFIAEFLGASCLESCESSPCSRPRLMERITEFQWSRPSRQAQPSEDQDHKTILLLEFLCRSGLQRAPVTVRAAHA